MSSPALTSSGSSQNRICKAIVYGNVSRTFTKKRESDGHTHEWTVYVKPYENEDMSAYVKKVQFKLHESYNNPNRVLSKPPYEVSETGWGEFEIQIKIHFSDTNERPLTFYHPLKLFHHEPLTTMAIVQGRKTVVSENYDEIVFHEASPYLQTLLTTTRPFTIGSAYKHESDFEGRKKRDLEQLEHGRQRVQAEISSFKERLQLAKETISAFKTELLKAQKNAVTDTNNP